MIAFLTAVVFLFMLVGTIVIEESFSAEFERVKTNNPCMTIIITIYFVITIVLFLNLNLKTFKEIWSIGWDC
jgi:divalent metal cation (Fe/Co/Zn/Cd) transporter